MFTRIKNFFINLFSTQGSPERLAASFCVGAYIAFSPFLGFHTVMALALAAVFGLNLTLVFAATHGINNPWTLIAVYGADYLFGHWLVHRVLHLPVERITPNWLHSMTSSIAYYTGLQEPCFWSFLIGGNLLGVLVSVLLYPIILQACYTLRKTNS